MAQNRSHLLKVSTSVGQLGRDCNQGKTDSALTDIFPLTPVELFQICTSNSINETRYFQALSAINLVKRQFLSSHLIENRQAAFICEL